MNTGDNMPFQGAKVALFLGRRLVVIQRDNFVDLPFAGFWDLPGGGREGTETPLGCVQRECFEELALRLPDLAVVWRRAFVTQEIRNWFFVAHLPEQEVRHIVFGDEGQCWRLMQVDDFLNHPKAVPAFQDRLRMYLAEKNANVE